MNKDQKDVVKIAAALTSAFALMATTLIIIPNEALDKKIEEHPSCSQSWATIMASEECRVAFHDELKAQEKTQIAFRRYPLVHP